MNDGFPDDAVIKYVHRFEYQWLDENGVWSEPEIRYHNPTDSEIDARDRHKSCKDVENVFGRKFEGIYGYRWTNCTLVKRVTLTLVAEDEI